MVTRIRTLEEAWTVDQLRNEPDSEITKAVVAAAGGGGGGGGGSIFEKVLSTTSLPVLLYSRRRYQQSAYNQDNVTTLPDGTQYVVALSAVSGVPHWFIMKRLPGSKTWQKFDLATVSSIFAHTDSSDDDSHNVMNVTVSSDGLIHVAGNMHGHPMRYARTTVAGDITTFAVASVASANANQVTYPMFFQVGGKQFFAWRNGLATSGDFFLSSWTGAAWTTPQKLLDGASSGRGAYLHRIAVRDGKVSMFFMYRGAGDASTNEGMYYVESVDQCATWQRISGAVQATPITPANADRFKVIPEAAGLINQGGADIDPDGHPHAAIQLYDSNGFTQLHHLWHDGTVWHDEQVTQWSERIETVGQTTLDLRVARPHLFCTDAGRTYMLGRTAAEGYANKVLLIDVTPGGNHDPVVITDMNLYGWEPAIDSRALQERGELNMLITNIDENADSKRNWEAQWGGILTIKLPQISTVQSGASKVPTIKKVSEYSILPEIPAVGGVTDADVSATLGAAMIAVNRAYGPGVRFFSRLSGRFMFNTGTTTATIYLRETPTGGSLPSNDINKIVLANNSFVGTFSTPWEPLPATPFVETNGTFRDTRLIPRIVADNAAGIKVGAWLIEVGILDLP